MKRKIIIWILLIIPYFVFELIAEKINDETILEIESRKKLKKLQMINDRLRVLSTSLYGDFMLKTALGTEGWTKKMPYPPLDDHYRSVMDDFHRTEKGINVCCEKLILYLSLVQKGREVFYSDLSESLKLGEELLMDAEDLILQHLSGR